MSKTVTIVQARMSSSRLPGKVLADIEGHPAIFYTLTRAAMATCQDEVWLACSDTPEDDPLAEYVRELGFPVFRGDEQDVLSRYASISRKTHAEIVIRVTGDSPLIDPDVIDLVFGRFKQGDVDYVSNGIQRSFPDGLDVEVFSYAALATADACAEHSFLREHVTPYMHGEHASRLPAGNFRRAQIVNKTNFSHLRWTIDYREDLEFIRRLVALLPDQYRWMDVIAILTQYPELLRINDRYKINEGTKRDLVRLKIQSRKFDLSNQYFGRASETIPLASQTFSKSYQQWVKGAAPLFLQEGSGCRVTDLDGNEYIDYLQGLMANILGYCDEDVNEAMRSQLNKGTNFSLPIPQEAELSELIVRLVPSAEMVRFGKNGSDATSAAIRLARAYTGRVKIAICGYHGWHDWYIGTTRRRLGVPRQVHELSETFSYNDSDSLESLLRCEPDAYAAVILEPASTTSPEPGFLENVRALTERYGAVLIFDEIISGFRLDLGGAQKKYKVLPDLCALGKAMANGMPISAVAGRGDIMRLMEDIFFSGTFGGEALSIVAAIATINKLERESVPQRLAARGGKLIDASNGIFAKNGLEEVLGFENEGWWPRLNLKAESVGINSNLVNSLWRQEMIANGLILASSYNLSLAHDSDSIMYQTLDSLRCASEYLFEYLNSSDPASYLRGEPIRPTFSVR